MTKRFKIEPDLTCPELAGYKLLPVERTTRTPIAIEVEMVEVFKDEYNHFSASTQLLIGKDIRKTTRPATNPDGTVKGVYIYE